MDAELRCVLPLGHGMHRRSCPGPEPMGLPEGRLPGAGAAGREGCFVTRRGEELFASRIRDGKCIMFPGSRHEIYRSENAVLERYMNTILDFLKK